MVLVLRISLCKSYQGRCVPVVCRLSLQSYNSQCAIECLSLQYSITSIDSGRGVICCTCFCSQGLNSHHAVEVLYLNSYVAIANTAFWTRLDVSYCCCCCCCCCWC